MQQLPQAFAAMASYRQWMLYKLVPSKKKPGKYDKLPCRAADGQVVTAHDPQNWTDADEAIARCVAMGTGYGVAFVLTANDPFWFLDIDSCAQDGQWSTLAQTMLTYFSGCAVEVSSSGTGLHIIGSGNAPPHGCKNVQSNLEFYTERRFIALTGAQASGDAGTIPPEQNLPWLVATYFQPGQDGVIESELSEVPVAEWRGPTDDDELIRRALRSVSDAAAFSGRATFRDLWEANAEALGRTWPPDPGSTDAYDASHADSALAAHLAFWTGKHGERVRALMERSALVRGKWEREDYIVGTINKACAVTHNVLQDKPVELPPIATSAPIAVDDGDTHAEPVPMASTREGATILGPDEQRELFKGCAYIRSLHRIWTPAGEVLKPESFSVAYGGFAFVMDKENGKISFNAYEAFTQSRVLRHPQVAATCFRPKLPPASIVDDGGRQAINTYIPLNIRRTDGDPSPFLVHVAKLFPDERDQRIFISYLAAMVQNIGTKFKWAIVLQGVEGNGKSFFSFAMQYALGKQYTHWPAAKEIGNKFNAWLFGRLLYCVEDIKVSRVEQEIMETLKPMITGESIEIEAKGTDQTTRDVCGNFIFNTNHKDGIRKSRNDRRYCIFFNPQQQEEDLERDGIDETYVSHLYDWAKGEGEFARMGENYGYSIIAHFLATYPIDPEFNPAGICQRAPKTSSTIEAVSVSLGRAEQYIVEAIEEGRAGFRGGYVSSVLLQQLLESQGLNYAPASRAQLMKNIGYMTHPHLPGGRVNNAVLPDGARCVLYVRVDRRGLDEVQSPAEIAKLYTAAQQIN